MNKTQSHHPLRIFGVSIFLTVMLGAIVAYYDGLAGIWLFTILVILEVTFSFDNAVINSKVLATLSPFWQKIFLTIGIFIAVFLVRFLLPIIIVMIAGNSDFMKVVDLAFNEPKEYAELLERSAPMINAFGGAFLLMIGLHYFIDPKKKDHWLDFIERPLGAISRYTGIQTGIMLVLLGVMYLTVDASHQMTVLLAGLIGGALHTTLHFISLYFERKNEQAMKAAPKTQLVGMAAFVGFMYLEVLDASFSLDGVIGAFAITSSVLLIIAGLGAGAVWVRSLTVYLLRKGTLAKYRYLEHGAHWAITALGVIMFVKLYGIEPPEWFTGGIGLFFIVAAVIASNKVNKNNSTIDI